MKSLSLCVIVFVLLTLFSTPVAEAVQGRTYTSKDANQNLNSNQPFQGQASEPITAQHPSGNTVNVPQGSDIANQNGDFSASQSSGATTPGGVSIGPATDLTSKQNGDLEAKTANTVKTPTSQANKVTDLKVSQDGKRFSTAQAEQIQAKTASKITKTKNAINYRQTVDDIEIEESDGFDSAPATQGSSQPYLSSDNADNIHQYQDGTITMDRADELGYPARTRDNLHHQGRSSQCKEAARSSSIRRENSQQNPSSHSLYTNNQTPPPSRARTARTSRSKCQGYRRR